MTERKQGARPERVLADLEGRVREVAVPAIPYARIEERAAARARSRRRRRGILAGAVTLVLLAGLAAWRLRPPPTAVGFQVASAAAGFRYRLEGGRVLVAEAGRASLTVKELATRIELDGAARLAREAAGVRVLGGAVLFEVEPRTGPALTVYVSGGRIEVLGTRFTVRQGEGTGELSLARGSVRFLGTDGAETILRPGERLSWPPPPSPAPDVAPPPDVGPVPDVAPPRGATKPRSRPAPAPLAPPPAPPPAPGPAPAPPASEAQVRERRIMAEIDRMRLRMEDEALVHRLDELLAEDLQEPLRERVSFERCDLLAHRPAAEREACRAIDQHLSRYGRGEYASRLEQTRRKLGCNP